MRAQGVLVLVVLGLLLALGDGVRVEEQSSGNDQSNPIATLVHGLIQGGVPTSITAKDASGSPIALANHNKIENDGPDDDTEAESDRQEESQKHFAQVNAKREQEERAKIKSEERSKQAELTTKKLMHEEKAKTQTDDLRHMSEQALKKGQLSMKTQVEVAEKQIHHANREVESVSNKVTRDKEMEIARTKYAARIAQRKVDFIRKKANEDINKLNKKTEMKVKSARRRNKLKQDQFNAEMKAKSRARQQKIELKREQERAIKRSRKRDEQDRKDKAEGDRKTKERRAKMKARDRAKHERSRKRRAERRAKFRQRAAKRRAEKAKKKFKERVAKYIRIPQSTQFQPRRNQRRMGGATIPNRGMFSWTFWVMPRGTVRHWSNLFHKGSNNGQRNPAVWFYPGSTRLHVRSGVRGSWNAGADPGQHLPVGRWTFVAITHRAGALRVYLNGHLRAAANIGAPLMNNGPLWTGDPWHATPQATMADLRMYPRILSTTEIREIQRQRKHP